MRIDLDVRRVWKCPQCGGRRKTAGAVTSLRCTCRPQGVLMQLQEQRREVKKFPYPADEPTDTIDTDTLDSDRVEVEPTDADSSQPDTGRPSDGDTPHVEEQLAETGSEADTSDERATEAPVAEKSAEERPAEGSADDPNSDVSEQTDAP